MLCNLGGLSYEASIHLTIIIHPMPWIDVDFLIGSHAQRAGGYIKGLNAVNDICNSDCLFISRLCRSIFFLFIFYANHPLQGFKSHCSVRGYKLLLQQKLQATSG